MICRFPFTNHWPLPLAIAVALGLTGTIDALSGRAAPAAKASGAADDASEARQDRAVQALSAEEWRRVDAAVERAVSWLVREQAADGSFPTLAHGQPGVTSLCVLALMAHGHQPGEGRYGRELTAAVDYIIGCQQRSGLLSLMGPEGDRITQNVSRQVGEAAAYNHAISAIALSEMYGTSFERREQSHTAIANALAATLAMQRWPKDLAHDAGGWRYVSDDGPSDSDLSITGWQLMFLRSARNAGFDVPAAAIDEAVAYVRRTFGPKVGSFGYTVADRDVPSSRGMAGAGILALGHAGFHDSTEAARSGAWLLKQDIAVYNSNNGLSHDRYHYSLFQSCQGMYQLGGQSWAEFYPRAVHTLLSAQGRDGSWAAERYRHDGRFGNAYTTALAILSLGAANETLPIFQR